MVEFSFKISRRRMSSDSDDSSDSDAEETSAQDAASDAEELTSNEEMKAAHNHRNTRLGLLFNSDEFSDCTIKCGDRSWKAHKVVLCTQCEPLARALKNQKTEEGATSTYTFEDEDPLVVEATLKFLYHLDYADEICDAPEMEPMVFHVSVFALAHMYQIGTLQATAQKKFKALAESCYMYPSFFTAVHDIYEKTPSEQREIRDIAVHIAWNEQDRLFKGNHTNNCARLVETPGFAADLAVKLMNEGRPE